MYKDRWRTRDLLLEYDRAIMPPRPRTAGLAYVYPEMAINILNQNDISIPPTPSGATLKSVYPWVQQGLFVLSQQLYQFAAQSGYTGTQTEFNKYFGVYLEQNRQEILFENFANFPTVGSKEMLYFGLDTQILYYWDNVEYQPVNAMLIAHTIVNGGGA